MSAVAIAICTSLLLLAVLFVVAQLFFPDAPPVAFLVAKTGLNVHNCWGDDGDDEVIHSAPGSGRDTPNPAYIHDLDDLNNKEGYLEVDSPEFESKIARRVSERRKAKGLPEQDPAAAVDHHGFQRAHGQFQDQEFDERSFLAIAKPESAVTTTDALDGKAAFSASTLAASDPASRSKRRGSQRHFTAHMPDDVFLVDASEEEDNTTDGMSESDAEGFGNVSPSQLSFEAPAKWTSTAEPSFVPNAAEFGGNQLGAAWLSPA